MMRILTNVEPTRLPYFCECSDPDCLRAVWLSPAEYDRRRGDSAARVLSDDHTPALAHVN